MIDAAAKALGWLTIVGATAWVGVLFYLAPRARRLLTSRYQHYDILAGVLSYLAVNRLWYQAKTLVYGGHVETLSGNEIIWTDVAQVCGIFGAVLTATMFAYYERSDVVPR